MLLSNPGMESRLRAVKTWGWGRGVGGGTDEGTVHGSDLRGRVRTRDHDLRDHTQKLGYSERWNSVLFHPL